jgi:gamma-glutamyltranspeptidase
VSAGYGFHYVELLSICSESSSPQIPLTDINSVTVPGAAAGWIKTVEEFGSGLLSMQEILEPAIRMAKDGVPTQELCSEAVSACHATS